VRYTVIWIPEAEAQLAAAWLDGPNRDDVRSAAFEVDRLLRTSPSNVGESRSEGQRILHVYPLGVRFMILEDDRVVQVLRVWRYKKLRPRS
jgi:hypothetical protein